MEAMHNAYEEFKKDIMLGLSQPLKSIPSKYFYDAKGSDLFTRITQHPDYYLTKCEMEILDRYKQTFSRLFGKGPFNLVELGPGNGDKALILLEQFYHDGLNVKYFPIDVSIKYLQQLTKKLHQRIPSLDIQGIHSDFISGLESLSLSSENQNVLLFLGSSIGNFDHFFTKNFLTSLKKVMYPGDYLLIGCDLKKDPEVLMRAYDDSHHLTRDFNLNMLHRINTELGADFPIEKFHHQPEFNESESAMESYLISSEHLDVTIASLGRKFTFNAGEPIYVESSYKYSLSKLKALAESLGFQVIEAYLDTKQYFVDYLWQVPIVNK